MLPWSVTATARMPAAATRLTRSFTFTAPSSSEYWVWTWRWTNSADMKRVSADRYRRSREDARRGQPAGRVQPERSETERFEKRAGRVWGEFELEGGPSSLWGRCQPHTTH